MNTTLKLLVASLACAAALPASAQSAGNFVDTANYVIDWSANNLAVGGNSLQRLAQTVTIEFGGNLAGVFLPILCGTGRVGVEIRDVVADQPGATVLARRAVSATTFDTDGRFTYVPLPGSLALTVGQRVAIVVDNPKGDCAMHQSTVAANYPGGQGFFEALPNPPGWVPFSDFPGTPDDLPFQLVLE